MDKARLGAIGENMVLCQLMQQGWDAANINLSIKNYKSVDIYCIDPNTNESRLIQVKTSIGKNFPTGFSLKQALDENYVKDKIIGPWVFVSVTGEKENMRFRYFVLSQKQVVDLIIESNKWYVYGYKRSRTLQLNSPCGLDLKWINGENVAATVRHDEFITPIKEVTENKWENIWKD